MANRMDPTLPILFLGYWAVILGSSGSSGLGYRYSSFHMSSSQFGQSKPGGGFSFAGVMVSAQFEAVS